MLDSDQIETVAKLQAYADSFDKPLPALQTVIEHLKAKLKPGFYEQACLDRELKMKLALISADNRRD